MTAFGPAATARGSVSFGHAGQCLLPFSEWESDVNSSGSHGVSDLQQQIDTLKQQLCQAQRLTALGELVSTTTHEFNNVLMTILNYAKMGMRHNF